MSDSNRSARALSSVTGPSGDGKNGGQPTNGNQFSSNNEGGPIMPGVQHAGTDEPKEAKAAASVAQPDPYQLRDLKAQEDMVYWAMWMFFAAILTLIVTSIGTWLIWRQVKLTREAVIDTSTATRAMERQNTLIESAQRPWVAIRCRLANFEKIGNSMSVDVAVDFENIGNTLAHDFYYESQLNVIRSKHENALSRVSFWFKKFREKRTGSNVALMPKEIATHRMRSHFSFREEAGKLLPVAVVVCAAAHYRVTPQSEWSETEVSFRLSGPDEFDVAIFPSIADGVHDDRTVRVGRYVTGSVT